MENKVTGRSFLPIVLAFVVCCGLILLGRPLWVGWAADPGVLLVGNVLLFLVTAVSFYLYTKGLRNNNIHAFVRVMYGSMLVKLFVCMLAALIYGAIVRQAASRNGIIGCFVLYVLYTFLEVRILLLSSKKNV
jgi:hypothetical protein